MSKPNDGTGNNESRDDWETPQWLFDILNEQYKFEIDCCANNKNAKCRSVGERFENYFNHMNKISWMNPPFSKAKQMIEHFFKIIKRGVGIYRIDNIESKLWKFIMEKADWIFIPTGRIAYEHDERKQQSPRFGSALFGIGVELPKGIQGITLTTVEVNKE